MFIKYLNSNDYLRHNFNTFISKKYTLRSIFSLKGIQPEIFNKSGFNPFLFACDLNSNIKIINYIHKLFPSFIHTKINKK